MNGSENSLAEIYAFRAVDDIGTAGQPTEKQIGLLREAGYGAVINLALATSDHALPHEGSLVTGLGMVYVHLPVDFQAPAARDFEVFCQVMQAFEGRPTFVHCAANMRVSSFLFLYRVKCRGVSVADAEIDLHAIWQPDAVWRRFIAEQLHEPVASPRVTTGIHIRPATAAAADIEGLAEVLLDCVAGGASIGFMHPFSRARAVEFWQKIVASATRGERTVLIAEDVDSGMIVGTVQAVWATAENQPHRADIAKMQVHRAARRRGVGESLMRAIEAVAAEAGKTVLVLDTVTGSDAERLYTRLGWQRCGVIPDYALWPQGGLCATTVFYRILADPGGNV